MTEVPPGQKKAVEPQMLWLGQRIKELRKNRGLRMVDVSDYMEIGHPRVADAETGRTDMKMSTFLRICMALGVSPSKVFEDCPQFKRAPAKAP